MQKVYDQIILSFHLDTYCFRLFFTPFSLLGFFLQLSLSVLFTITNKFYLALVFTFLLSLIYLTFLFYTVFLISFFSEIILSPRAHCGKLFSDSGSPSFSGIFNFFSLVATLEIAKPVALESKRDRHQASSKKTAERLSSGLTSVLNVQVHPSTS